jgi:ABC-type lipoprotein release transport system permease subunit
MIYGRMGWREIRKRPGRAALTLFSVVIGVSAVVAVTFTTQSTRRAFDDMYQSIAGKAAWEVSAPPGATIDESLAETIAHMPGVEAASPIIRRGTILYAGDKSIKLPTVLGIDPEQDKAVHDFVLESGEPLTVGNGVYLGAEFAHNQNIKAGDRVKFLTPGPSKPTKVLGLYTSKGTATTSQGAVVLIPLRLAQQWFKATKKLDHIQIVVKPAGSAS